MTDPELYRTAIHEAGHAVAFVRLFPGRYGDTVTIEPEAGNLGAFTAEDVSFVEASATEDDARQQFLNHAVYCCAGYAAVLATGEPEHVAVRGCELDFEQAEPFLEEGKRIATALMSQPGNVKAVKMLADELLQRRTMIWDLTAVLIDVADGEATPEDYQGFLAFMQDVKAS